jgi:disulfide bond formation protein DsbB
MTGDRLIPLIVFLVSGALLLGALGFQYIGGLAPCQLCLWQRYPHDAVVVVAAIAVLVAPPRMRLWLLGLCGAILLVGAAIALFHVGVEYKWWPGLPSCSGTVDMTKLSPEEMRKMVIAGPPPRCDEVAWSLFGISMAGYNFLISLAVGAFALAAAFRLRKRA